MITVVDYIEEADWNGNPYLKLIDKQGVEFRLGKHLSEKYGEIRKLEPGTPVELIMAKFNKDGVEKEYVKDIRRAINSVADKVAERLAPVKNIKDISIEAQVAVRCVTDVMVAGGTVPNDIRDMSLEWMRKALKAATE